MASKAIVTAVIALAATATSSADVPGYCEIDAPLNKTLLVRPAADEPPIVDVNWFARPVPNPAGDWIVAYAMHDENHLYNLTTGDRVRIPDRSDAVATPDGKYMTVPSFYTPDGFVRFYDTAVLLDHLERGVDAADVEPLFIHQHEGLTQTFYQSLGHVEHRATRDGEIDTYRMIFSGTVNESGFRMVDYTFETKDGELQVTPGEPLPLCPEIENDLMTPFISKDGRYVAAYTSPITDERYAAGASLRIYRIDEAALAAGQARCSEVVDLGFAAGKADFSFDGDLLTFHISNVNYLSVFINGGEVFGVGDGDMGPLSTDVVVARLSRDGAGEIDGIDGLRRLTVSGAIGSGRFFPAFLPDGKLYYLSHVQPTLVGDRRFHFEVVDPAAAPFGASLFDDADNVGLAREIGTLWTKRCMEDGSYEFADHELPWFLYNMSAAQCRALTAGDDRLGAACGRLLE